MEPVPEPERAEKGAFQSAVRAWQWKLFAFDVDCMRQNLLVRIYYMQFGGPVALPYVVYSANYVHSLRFTQR